MFNSLRWIACCVLIASSMARADQVQLPFQMPDANGNQWFVYYQGNLQHQGNQPVFSQAGMISINSQPPQQNTQTANFDEKNKEISLNFVSRNTNLKYSRRIKFDESGSVARILDIFENTSGQELPLNIGLVTTTNFAVSDSSVIADPRRKGAMLGCTMMTTAEKCAMSLLAGKGSKITPTVRVQPNGNNANATFQLKISPNAKLAIVHWHGAFDSVDAANQWIDQLRESKALSDLPLELRKTVVNVSDVTGGMIGGREVLRGSTDDVIELIGGDVIKGELKADTYTLNTTYGQLALPANKIAGIIAAGEARASQLLVTTEGEIFSGRLEQSTLPITLNSGQVTQVPMAQVARLGYRTNGVEPAPWKLDRPMVFLTGGERCLIKPPTESLDFLTRYGAIQLAPAQIASVLFSNVGNAYQVFLKDGSRLSGVLSQSTWPLQLSSTASDAPIVFPIAALARVQLAPLSENVGAGAATMGLLGDDIVVAKLAGEIKLRTAFDTITINGAQVQSVSRPQSGQPEWQVTLFDQSTFRGTPDLPSLAIEFADGIKLQLPLAAVQDYQNPKPYPSDIVTKRANDAVRLLNDDNFKQRETAEAQLLAMGPSVVVVLDEAVSSQPAEAKERLLSILKRLKAQQPTLPTRLTPPPTVQ